MPELPEIETVRLQLIKVIKGAKVQSCKVLNKNSVHGDVEKIVGEEIIDIRRRAKVLIIDFSGDVSVAFHFKMSGQLVFEGHKVKVVGGHPTEDFVGKLPSGHTRVVVKFDLGTLYFNDQRMFGWVKVGDKFTIDNLQFIKNLGPEPFDITAEEFVRRVQKSRRAIKLTVMDQEVISGVGNIYANDALWEARINPQIPSHKLQREQLETLLEKLKLVLSEGIKYGGATAADAKYIDLHGLGGHYQEHFRVYDREGQMCKRCKSVIVKFVLGGRGTYVCPKCQPE